MLLVDAGGGTVGDRGSLERGGWWTLPYEVVGRPAALPGSDPGRPTLLTTKDALFSRLGDDLDPRAGPLEEDAADLDGPWSTKVWLDGTVDDAIGALAAVDVRGQQGVEVRRTLAGVRTQVPFLAATWSLGVLAGLAVVVLALALLLLAGTRSRSDDAAALELAMLERLGLPGGRQLVAAVVERVLLVAAAGVIGVVTGVALAALVAGAADPRPELVPALAVSVPVALLAGLGAVLVAGGVVAGVLDHRAAVAVDVEEALRVAD